MLSGVRQQSVPVLLTLASPYQRNAVRGGFGRERIQGGSEKNGVRQAGGQEIFFAFFLRRAKKIELHSPFPFPLAYAPPRARLNCHATPRPGRPRRRPGSPTRPLA